MGWNTLQRELNKISEALASVADGVKSFEHEARWVLGFGACEVEVRSSDGWLCFDAPYGGALGADWSLLAGSAQLSAGVKLVRSGAEDAVRVRGELPLASADELLGQVKRIRRGYEQATAAGLAASASCQSGDAVAVEEAGDAGNPMSMPMPMTMTMTMTMTMREADVHGTELAALCELAQLPFASRSADHGVVDLFAGPGFWQAELRRTPAGDLWLRTALAEPSATLCSTAQARLLLRVGGSLRLVRATASSGDVGQRHPAFEAVLTGTGGAPSEAAEVEAAQLADGAGALAAACRYAGEETRLLANSESLARAYFELSPGSGRKAQTPNAPTRNRDAQASLPQVVATGQAG
jgi:hypothetical protein